MKIWLYSELAAKVNMDLDLMDESFITSSELIGYCNEAIEDAEAEILKINEDYFLSSATMAWTAGTSLYALPSDIYISKIRSLMYVNGTDVYAIKRIRTMDEFENITEIANFEPNAQYQYIVRNASAAAGIQVQVFPAPRNTGTFVTAWYIRSANRISVTTDPLDIPEFASFIMQFMKVRCYEKEGHPNLQMAIGALDKQRTLMIESLTEMVPDNNNQVPCDFSHYSDHT